MMVIVIIIIINLVIFISHIVSKLWAFPDQEISCTIILKTVPKFYEDIPMDFQYLTNNHYHFVYTESVLH